VFAVEHLRFGSSREALIERLRLRIQRRHVRVGDSPPRYSTPVPSFFEFAAAAAALGDPAGATARVSFTGGADPPTVHFDGGANVSLAEVMAKYRAAWPVRVPPDGAPGAIAWGHVDRVEAAEVATAPPPTL
jgi:hypothetical protein